MLIFVVSFCPPIASFPLRYSFDRCVLWKFARYINPFEGGRGAHIRVQVDGLARQAWYAPLASNVAARTRCTSMSPSSSRAVQNRQTTERVKSAILNSESATAPPTTTFGSHRRMHAVVRGGVLRALATLKPPKPQPNAREQRVVPLGHLAVACHGKQRKSVRAAHSLNARRWDNLGGYTRSLYTEPT
jgi:hypothetical protein